MTGNSPTLKYKKGTVSLAVFNGQFGENIVLQKSYLKKGGNKDKREDWVTQQINLFLSELPSLKEVVDKAMIELGDKTNPKKE